MENIFYKRKISLKFDLKGNKRNRYIGKHQPIKTDKRSLNKTLLDVNFLEITKGQGIPLVVCWNT